MIKSSSECESQGGPNSVLEQLPIEVIALISEFIGSNNSLAYTSRHMKGKFVGRFALKYLAARMSGFEWIKGCNPSGPDVNSLMKLPKFPCDLCKFQFFLDELLRNGYKSISIPLFGYIIDTFCGLSESNRALYQGVIKYLLRKHYSTEIHIKLADSVPQFALEFLPALSYDELKDFLRALRMESIDNEELKLLACPFFMLVADDSNNPLLSVFEGLPVEERVALIKKLIFDFDSSHPEALNRLKAIRTTHLAEADEDNNAAFIIDIYLKACECSEENQNELVEIIHLRELNDFETVNLIELLLTAGKMKIAENLLYRSDNSVEFDVIGLFLRRIYKLSQNRSLSNQIKLVRSLAVLSGVSEAVPLEDNRLDGILRTFFTFYEVESVEFDPERKIWIKINSVPVKEASIFTVIDGIKAELRQEFTAPISFKLAPSISSLVKVINSKNLNVLEDLLNVISSDSEVELFEFGLSESFIIAAQISESFSERLFAFLKGHRLEYRCDQLLEAYKYPIKNVNGRIDVTFEDLAVLDHRKGELGSALGLCGQTCLSLYRALKGDTFTFTTISSLRPFFLYWIESNQSETLAETRNPELLEHFSAENPKKIEPVRKKIQQRE